MAEAKERRIPTAVVLAVASTMVSIGIVAVLVAQSGGRDPVETAPRGSRVEVDATTPERAAESFLDAWRKREHDIALSLADGRAKNRVLERQAEDAALTEEERALKVQVWDSMAEGRLRFAIRESEALPGGRLALRGTAEGEFLGRPYRRDMEFTVTGGGESWKVVDFRFGEILTDVPGSLEIDPARDPGAIEPRGEDVP